MQLDRMLKRSAKSWIIDRLFTYSGSTYQRDRFSLEKYNMIAGSIDLNSVRSVLDVGCNEGYITAAFADRGTFCVGIDAAPLFLNHVLNSVSDDLHKPLPAFGTFTISPDNTDNLPQFDLVLLLSVHHQLIKNFGDDYTRNVVRQLANKAARYFVIEFAATRDKYGFTKTKFIDNDERSVCNYAEAWLRDLDMDMRIEYLGKNREHSESVDREPYRFSFLLTR